MNLRPSGPLDRSQAPLGEPGRQPGAPALGRNGRGAGRTAGPEPSGVRLERVIRAIAAALRQRERQESAAWDTAAVYLSAWQGLHDALRRPDVRAVAINGPHDLFVDRNGTWSAAPAGFRDELQLCEAIGRLAGPQARSLWRTHAAISARLADGSLLCAVPSFRAGGRTLALIRKSPAAVPDLRHLVALGCVGRDIAERLADWVMAGGSIFAAGQGWWQQVLLGTLSRLIPPERRVVTLEDGPEIPMGHRHVARLVHPPLLAADWPRPDAWREALELEPDLLVIDRLTVRGARQLARAADGRLPPVLAATESRGAILDECAAEAARPFIGGRRAPIILQVTARGGLPQIGLLR